MARRISVEIVGDSSSLERSFRRSSRAANGFNRDLNRSFRGAIAGSGAFRTLGRSVAFASSAFLGGVGISAAIRASIGAQQEQVKTTRQLAAQFRASGVQLRNYKDRIDDAAQSFVKLGIQDDETVRAFTTLFRASGNVSESLDRLGLVADFAAARHIDLQKAALLVGKVETGNTGILRRYGVQVEKTATVQEALSVATQKFAGQAKASVTPQARFAAILDRTEEIIGSALLPVFTRLLERGGNWLNQLNESGRLQENVNRITKRTGEVLSTVRDILSQIITVGRAVNNTLGGLENTVRLLAAAFVGVKAAQFAASIGLLATNAKTAAIGMKQLRGSILLAAAAWLIFNRNKNKAAFDKGGRFEGIGKFLRAIAPGGREVGVFDPKQNKLVFFNDGLVDANKQLGEMVGKLKNVKGALKTVFAKDFGDSVAKSLRNAVLGVFGQGAGGSKANLSPFALPFGLQLKQAQAEATKARRDDLVVAKQVKAFAQSIIASVQPLVDSGQLQGKALKTLREKLLAAYQALAGANATLADAATDSAKKVQAAAAEQKRKNAEALRKQREALEKMRQRFTEALGTARDQIGGLFEGPILNPTDAQTRARLGFPGADIGRLTADVRAQTSQFKLFLSLLSKIQQRGGSPELLKELRARGVAGIPELQAIAGAAPMQFQQFLRAFAGREGAAIKAATVSVNARVVNIRGGGGKNAQTFELHVDGKQVEVAVTKRQQRKDRSRGQQRRGNQGGMALAQ